MCKLTSVQYINLYKTFAFNVFLFSGSLSVLAEYETSRQKHNFPTAIAIDGLQKLYGTSFTPLVLLRSLGLQLTNSLEPLKVIKLYIF